MILKLSAAALIASLGWTQPQAGTATPPAFEVASVKLHVMTGQGGRQRVGVSISGNGITASVMTLANLLQYAYDLKPYQISGGPGWTTSDRWDIAAKADRDTPLTRDDVKKMLGALLADRFRVIFHRDNKDVPMYALVVAGKGPPKLKESAPDAVGRLSMTGSNTIQITVTKGSMDQLTNQLSGNLDRPVVDHTGLPGTYDYRLEWAPDRAQPDAIAPSVFTALQEQLGLKLEATTGSVPLLVLDHVEKPSDN